MAIERIPCGGWDIDNTTFAFVKAGKKKVLTVIAGSQSDPSKLPLTGGSMLGPIELEEGAQPTQPNHVVDKQYVDDTVLGYLKTSGGTMTGAIAMGSQKITGLADATDPGDALNKKVADATYALKTAIPTNATTATAGIVKQATAIEDSSGATDTALETKFNALLAALRTAGVLASS